MAECVVFIGNPFSKFCHFWIFLLENFMEASLMNILNSQKKSLIFLLVWSEKIIEFFSFLYLSGGYAPLIWHFLQISLCSRIYFLNTWRRATTPSFVNFCLLHKRNYLTRG